ncbi:MAG: hypothetical protein ACW967_00065 [Candidatus Hodarchaeales archaeon]|jgi:hypothetical protein
MSLSDFGKRFLLLGLRIGQHIDGYIDAYFGPPELKQIVEKEGKQSPNELLMEAENLVKQIENQLFSESRNKYFEKTLQAMITTLKVLLGKKYQFLELVEKVFDIKPTRIEEKHFFQIADELENLYDGSEPLSVRIARANEGARLTNDQIQPTFQKAFDLTRKRTLELYRDLIPKNEGVTLNYVSEAPWGAYNWYLGNFQSRIDINTERPMEWYFVLLLASHEGYCGHHTENLFKEQYLYIDNNQFEDSIKTIQTPDSVISEGIGNVAISVLWGEEESTRIALEQICPDPEKEVSVEILTKRKKLLGKMQALQGNLAIFANEDRLTDDELLKYVKQFGFVDESMIAHRLKFIRNPLWSSYVFNYYYGTELIKDKYGSNPSPKDFEILLRTNVLPSDLR